jgi:hypothetical protein
LSELRDEGESAAMNGQISYLNTDLDLVSGEDLRPLVEALESEDVFSLHVTSGEDGLWYSTLETNQRHIEPEPNIAAILNAIETLPAPTASLWSRCTRREFNVGYDCGQEPWSFNQGISSAILGRMAAVGASLRFTLYPKRDVKP